MRKPLLTAFFFIIPAVVFSQQFGGTPPSQKWKQVNTDTVRVIFPAGLDSQANRIASIVHYMASQKPVSLGNKLEKVNIVLQNQTTIANGYVNLGPYRSEFYLTPASNNFELGSIPWNDQLALHEYRHVQQFNNFKNGLSKVAYYLFGEEGYSLAINASVPDWFYEGDAVYNETVLSKQGRGRLPNFLNGYPSLWQAGKKYNWSKLRNGSLKDYVPTHYQLGYLLVNYGREKYGADFWAKVTQDATAFKGLFYPFQAAIRRHAGVDYETFRQQAFDFYKKNTERTSASRDEYLFPVNKNYVTNYYFPYSIGADSLVYLKSSYRHRPAFFIKDKNGEHRLKVRDISIDEQFSYRNGRIVYAAYQNDPRWGWRDYSVIKLLDVHTGQQQTLTSKTKYFTPDISEDGSKVAAVQVATNGRSELHILDVQTGKPVKAIHSSEISLFTDPKFIDDKSLVTAVRLLDGTMTLALAEVETGVTTRLIPPSYNVVGYPNVNDGIIYFTASYAGNDDVFALRLSDKKLFRISNGPLGNYFVNAGHGRITWSTFTAEGYQLKQVDEKSVSWTEMSDAVTMTEKFVTGHAPGMGDVLLSQVSQRSFTTKDYKKSTRLINFHSWRPYYEDPIFTYSLYGENVLNTLRTEIYYLYNQNEKTSAVGASAAYAGWFPYISAGTEYTFDRQGIMGNKVRHWDQLDSRIGLSVPLSFTSGQTYKSFNASTNYVLRNEFNKGFFKDSMGNTNFSYLLHTISWTQQVQRARQHIFPRFGYSLSANYRHAISRYEGYQFIGAASLYLPGILSNHNLVLSGGLQQRDTSMILFASRLATARGYEDYYYTTAGSRLWRLSADYHLPLWHPDFGIANIVHLQRIRANLFYDVQRLFSNNKRNTADLRSAGVELYVDTRWWNQHPLTFGFRISHLLDNDPLGRNAKGSNIFEFILPVTIFPR